MVLAHAWRRPALLAAVSTASGSLGRGMRGGDELIYSHVLAGAHSQL